MPPARRRAARPPVPPLHVIAADEVLRRPDFEHAAAAMLERHGDMLALHLRGHGMDGRALFRLAAALAPVAERTGGLLVVNDRVDVALCAGAGGIQLGARSLPVAVVRTVADEARLVGYSAHAAEEAVPAERAGADWVLAGTIFETASHPGRPGAGPALVRAMADRVSVPVVAIGGITPERVAEVVVAGAAGVAVLGGVWRAGDPLDALERYRAALDGADTEDSRLR